MKLDEELDRKQAGWVEYMLRPESDGAALLAVDMGLGKTRTALMFARAYGAECLLVVAPLSTLESWETTAGVEYPELPVYLIDSSPKGKKAMANFRWRVRGIYLVTHHYWERQAWKKVLKKKRRKDEPDKMISVPADAWLGPGFTLVFDECHRASNTETGTHNALMNIHPDVFKIGMSGTFAGNQFDGAYGATRWLWPHRTDIIPGNIFAWRGLWAKIKFHPFAPRNQEVVGEKDEGAFVSSLPCYIREETELEQALKHEVWYDLYPEQRRIYDELDAKMVAWILEDPLAAEYTVTKRARQRQATLAMLSLEFDDDTYELTNVYFEDDAESVKTDGLIAELQGEGQLGDLMVDEQVLVLTDSQQYAKLLTARLNDALGPNTAREWSGKTRKAPMKREPDGLDRKTIKQDFIDGNIRILVGVQSAMGTGTDGLQHSSCSIVAFMSLDDSRINNEQGLSRLRRKGQTKRVHEVHFRARDTVDTGQSSKQLEDALKMQRIQRAKYKEEQRARKQSGNQ